MSRTGQETASARKNDCILLDSDIGLLCPSRPRHASQVDGKDASGASLEPQAEWWTVGGGAASAADGAAAVKPDLVAEPQEARDSSLLDELKQQLAALEAKQKELEAAAAMQGAQMVAEHQQQPAEAEQHEQLPEATTTTTTQVRKRALCCMYWELDRSGHHAPLPPALWEASGRSVPA